MLQTMPISFGPFPSKNPPTFLAQELRKNLQFMRIFMRTGITKMQKVTEVYYNAKDPIAGVYTHDTKQKKRLLAGPVQTIGNEQTVVQQLAIFPVSYLYVFIFTFTQAFSKQCG